MRFAKVAVALLTSGLVLAGCSQTGINEIQQWMSAEEKKMKGKVEAVSEPKPFKAFKYEAEKEVDPFNASKVTALVDAAKKNPRGASGIRIDETRPRQVLEAFPLENLKMVGVLQQKGGSFGLINADKNLYRVKVGEYMGQNHGLITKINESEITVREVVSDATGELIERISTMQLQEVRT